MREPVWDEAAIEAVASALRPLADDKVAKGWNTDAAGYGLYDVMTDEWLPGQVFQPRLGDVRKAEYFAREVVAAYFAALDREALIEPFDGLLEALERVDYEGQIGDVEDVDDTRADAIAALPRLRAALGLIPTEGGDDA